MESLVLVVECLLLRAEHAALGRDLLLHVRQLLLQLLDVFFGNLKVFLVLVKPLGVHVDEPAVQSDNRCMAPLHVLILFLLKLILGKLKVVCYFGNVVVLGKGHATKSKVLADLGLLHAEEDDRCREKNQS